MDVAVAVLYYKHSNSIDKFASTTSCPETSDFEILLEDVYVPSVSGGSFVPADDADIFRSATCSPSSTSSNSSGNGISDRRSPLSSRENLKTVSSGSKSFRSASPRSLANKLQSPVSDSSNRTPIPDGPVKLMKHLPRKGISFDQEPNEIASVFACKLLTKSLSSDSDNGKLFRRAVPVALWKSEPSSPYSAVLPLEGQSGSATQLVPSGLSAALFCVPILEKGNGCFPDNEWECRD